MHLLTTTSAIIQRFLIRWQKTWINYFFLRVVEPTFFLYALGFGLGRAFETVGDLPYLNFVVPGIMVSALMYATLLDGMYGTLTRLMYQKTWSSQLATIVTMRQILLTESGFIAFKSAIGSICVFSIGALMGGVDMLWGIFPALIFLLLGSMTLSALGQTIASFHSGYDELEYVWALLIAPMFLFSNIFIPLESFPDTVQILAQALPLYHIVELVRGSLTGTLSFELVWPHVMYLLGLFALLHTIAHQRYKNRIFS